jgi:hypothetical protein
VTEPLPGPGGDSIEVVPVVVLSQSFPARPSSIPDIRDFVRRCLAESPLTDEGTREVGETVFRALLDAAGPTGRIQVAFRIFPEHVEVDVLHSEMPVAEPVQLTPQSALAMPPALPALPGDPAAAWVQDADAAGAPVWPGASPAQAAPRGGRPRRPGRPARRQRSGPARAAGHLRRVDVERASPGGPDPGGRRAAARRVGQDRQPLGRRRDRAADARPAADPGSVRRGPAPVAALARRAAFSPRLVTDATRIGK